MNVVAGSTPRTEAPTWRELVDEAGDSLASPTEARWIAEDVVTIAGLTYRDAADVTPGTVELAEFARLVARRAAGEPLQHVLGHWPFRTVDLLVDRRALVPRPETEMVVDYALAELRHLQGCPLVVDLGTGSGAIACSVATEHPLVTVIATDVSEAAVALAKSNRDRLSEDVARRIDVWVGDWFEALPPSAKGRVDVVVSNPPYVAEHEWSGLDRVVRDFDPRAALVAGPIGTEAIEKIIDGIPDVIADGGSAVLEIAPSQSEFARASALAAGACAIEIRSDLAGRDRVLIARW
ncbi:MAG: peptide chain release factor N(5)-glutamine methyltransferase [Acidimicrobiales bacterium]